MAGEAVRAVTAVLLALSLLPAGVSAQQQPGAGRVMVSGVVLDSITGRPVVAATVTFRASHRVAFTDSLGRFLVDATPVAAEQIQARQLGYAPASFELPIRGDSPPILVYLSPDPVPLRAITARAKSDGRYTIEGTVVDSLTGRPVPRAVVWFRSSAGNAVTDTFGHYVFDGAKGGPEDVVVDVLGYHRRVAYPRISEPWQRLDLALEPDPIVLQGIVAFAERLQQVSVHEAGFRHYFSERDLAESGRKAVSDFMQWSQTYSPAHGRRQTETGPVLQIPCMARGGIRDEGGSLTTVIANGRPVLGGELGPLQVQPSDFYRAVFVRDFRCGGHPYVLVFSKSQLRNAFHGRRGEVVISRDSLERLLAAVDTLR